MKSHLVGFGCSWIHGDEIDHPTASPGTKEHRVYRESNCFLGQLGAQLGMTVENYGISGSSLQSTLWEFARWAQSCEDTSRYLVVIGLTDDARTSWWNGPNRNNVKYGGDYMHNHWDHPKHMWHDFIRWHAVMSDDPDLRAMNYWTTVNFFDNYCAQHSIPLLQINTFRPTSPVYLPSIYNPEWNMRGAMQSDQLAPGKHPNESGANWLATHFTSDIKSRKILEC
jgi:hypothetical protein